jgi:hypothetical protein
MIFKKLSIPQNPPFKQAKKSLKTLSNLPDYTQIPVTFPPQSKNHYNNQPNRPKSSKNNRETGGKKHTPTNQRIPAN